MFEGRCIATAPSQRRKHSLRSLERNARSRFDLHEPGTDWHELATNALEPNPQVAQTFFKYLPHPLPLGSNFFRKSLDPIITVWQSRLAQKNLHQKMTLKIIIFQLF